MNKFQISPAEYYRVSRGDMIILNKKKRIICSVDSVISLTIWGGFVSRIILFWWRIRNIKQKVKDGEWCTLLKKRY